MNEKGLYAFYGSLRKGMELHDEYLSGMRHLITIEVTGFRLFSLISYPYAVKTHDRNCRIMVELYDVHDVKKAKEINDMELEAGYYYDEIQHDGTSYGIYLFKGFDPQNEEIFSGDWVQYVRKIGF